MNYPKSYSVYILELNKQYSFFLDFKLQNKYTFEVSSFENCDDFLSQLYARPAIILIDSNILNVKVEYIINLIYQITPHSLVIFLANKPADLKSEELINEIYYKLIMKEKDATKQSEIIMQEMLSYIDSREAKLKKKRLRIFVGIVIVIAILVGYFLFYFK